MRVNWQKFREGAWRASFKFAVIEIVSAPGRGNFVIYINDRPENEPDPVTFHRGCFDNSTLPEAKKTALGLYHALMKQEIERILESV